MFLFLCSRIGCELQTGAPCYRSICHFCRIRFRARPAPVVQVMEKYIYIYPVPAANTRHRFIASDPTLVRSFLPRPATNDQRPATCDQRSTATRSGTLPAESCLFLTKRGGNARHFFSRGGPTVRRAGTLPAERSVFFTQKRTERSPIFFWAFLWAKQLETTLRKTKPKGVQHESILEHFGLHLGSFWLHFEAGGAPGSLWAALGAGVVKKRAKVANFPPKAPPLN